MRLEALRVTANAWTDPTTGVNARLSSVPRDGTDPAPPNLVTITDETRSRYAALDQVPPAAQCPGLLLSLYRAGNVLDPHQKQAVHDGTVTMLARYVQRITATERGTQDAYYTFRAVDRCLDAWIGGPDGPRTMNNLIAWYFEARAWEPMWTEIGDLVITGGMILAVRMRDLAP